MEILKLKPVGKDYLWGGTKLKEKYGKDCDLTPLAETWECSTHPNGLSIVLNGKYKDKTLAFVLKKHPEYLGKYKKRKSLPILVKFIDANQDLSVQVHPNDKQAMKLEKQSGKAETWYVVEAEEGAKLVYGFEHPVTEKILTEAVETGEIEKHLHFENVQAGDTFYMPAGTVHAIGKGMLLVEVQESSDVTYHIYDYDRVDKNGNKCKLDFEKALQVMNMQPTRERIVRNKLVRYFDGYSEQVLINCKAFNVKKLQIHKVCEYTVDKTCFEHLLCIEGSGRIETADANEYPFETGESLFIPANTGCIKIKGECTVILSKC